jgi:hypothetical protein
VKAPGALRQNDIVEFIGSLFDGDLHAKRVLSLANGTLGVLSSASLAVHAIGQGLAHAQGTLSKHGVKQVERLLSNRGIEVDAFFEHWVAYVIGVRTSLVIALDWTSFARDGHETLVLSMLTRHGRATPLLWRTVEADTLKGKQTDYEDALLCRLYDVLPAAVRATIVADRGFADCKLLKLLSEELGFDYVVRLRSQYYVTNAKGERRKAAKWVGAGGRARTLRDATLTDSHELPVATVVCVQASDMKEPWCLVASDREATAKTLIGYYGKRWGIETSFRDIKDLRFGMGMSALRIRSPERRDRLLLLSALAIALLSLLGAAGEALGYDRWLKANTVKRRTHSLFRQGLMLYEHILNWPEERLRPLLEKFAELLHQQRMFRDAFGLI